MFNSDLLTLCLILSASKLSMLSFFSWHGYFFTFTEAPFNLFWTLTMILAIFVFWKNYETFLVQNLGHNLHKKCKIVIFWSSLSEKQPFTFKLLFGRLKTLLDTLTYSAIIDQILDTIKDIDSPNRVGSRGYQVPDEGSVRSRLHKVQWWIFQGCIKSNLLEMVEAWFFSTVRF